jgi:predicted MPP superfamily phosphohydrolase
MSLFGVVVPSIVLIGHYFIYFSIVRFFGVANGWRRAVLALVLFLLPASFVFARGADNSISRALYFYSGLWVGVAVTLMTFFVIAWATWGAVKLITHSPSPAVFGWVAVALAGVYSGYGVWNAYHPRVKEVVVRIRNLPPDWHGKKVVHLSDVHLGRILGVTFLRRIVEEINAANPSVVLITGDFVEGRDGSLEELVRPLDDITAPLGIYCVTGNHDRGLAAVKETRARILRNEMAVVNGLQIIGVSYAGRGVPENLGELIARLPGYNPQIPSVLLHHSPTQVEQAKAAGISLQLSGHTHKGQIFPVQFISWMMYGKYYNGLHIEGDCAIYTSSGAGTWGPTMRTGNHPEIAVIRLEPM